MPFASRLKTFRDTTTKTVDVVSKTISPSYSESNVYTGLTAVHYQDDAFELITDTGATVLVADVFLFYPATPNAALPTITEAHLVYDGSVRYEIIQVKQQTLGGKLLKVVTRRAR